MAWSTQSVFEQPAYSYAQAAHYLGLNYSTLRGWATGEGLIQPPTENALSFYNLAEAHILKAMRRVHKLPLQRIRKALQELAQTRQTAHPLLDETFETNGVDLCIREGMEVVNLSRRSQQEIREFVELYFQRVKRTEDRKVSHLFPFIVADQEGEPMSISISPTVSFGKPVLTGTGISTAIVAGRFSARDSLSDLSHEYQVEISTLEDAIRWEMSKGKAA